MFRIRNRKPLSPLEHEIMEVVWGRESTTADQVREALAGRRALKDSSIRTMLGRLEKKGYLAHKVASRTYVYRALDVPTNVAVSLVRQAIDRFCGGSVERLLVGMVESEVLDKKELKRLADKLARAKKTPKE
jgi:predicted transcriptional regulator